MNTPILEHLELATKLANCRRFRLFLPYDEAHGVAQLALVEAVRWCQERNKTCYRAIIMQCVIRSLQNASQRWVKYNRRTKQRPFRLPPEVLDTMATPTSGAPTDSLIDLSRLLDPLSEWERALALQPDGTGPAVAARHRVSHSAIRGQRYRVLQCLQAWGGSPHSL